MAVPPSSSLMTLPRELRDIIYDLLFENTKYNIREPGYTCQLWYGNAPYNPSRCTSHANVPPRWLGTSKRIYHEAREQFYRRVQFDNIWKASVRPDQDAAPTPERFLCAKDVTRFDCKALSRTNEVLGRKLVDVEPGIDVYGLFRTQSYLVESLSLVRRVGATLTEFIMGLTICADWKGDINRDFEWDLSPLAAPGVALKRVEFVIIEPYFVIRRCPAENLLILMEVYEELQRSMVDVATALVGGSGKHGFVVRDWISEDVEAFSGRTHANWHLETRRSCQGGVVGTIEHEGLRSFKGDDGKGRVFKLLVDEENGDRMFHCETSGRSVEIRRDGEVQLW